MPYLSLRGSFLRIKNITDRGTSVEANAYTRAWEYQKQVMNEMDLVDADRKALWAPDESGGVGTAAERK